MFLKWISVLFLGSSLPAAAQQFTWEAALPAPDSAGYYRVAISPAVAARAYRYGEWDIRLFSGKQEIPYVLQQAVKGTSKPEYTFFMMSEPDVKPGAYTRVEFQHKGFLSEFKLIYANTAVRKEVRITGSNDKKTWYALRDPFLLNPAGAERGSSGALEETIYIPASNWQHYRLQLNDSVSAPIEVMFVATLREGQAQSVHTLLPDVKVTLLPAGDRRNDRYCVVLPEPMPASGMHIAVKSPEHYRRRVYLEGRVRGKGYWRHDFFLDTKTPAGMLELPAQGLLDTIYINIENGDNTPLELGGVQVWQDSWFLLAKLEKGGKYLLRGGDENLHIPQYDLANFREEYDARAKQVLVPAAPVKLEVAATESPSFFTSKWWVWAGIAGIVVVLGLVVRRMMREL